MEYMHRIKKMLCKELEEYAEKNKLSSASDLEMIWRLTDTIKNIDKIEMFEEETGIMVNYQTVESNEALYALLKAGADVLVAGSAFFGATDRKAFLQSIEK